MIGMSDNHIVESFKESFSPELELKLLEIYDMDTAIVKSCILLLLLKSELSQAASSSMLAQKAESQ